MADPDDPDWCGWLPDPQDPPRVDVEFTAHEPIGVLWLPDGGHYQLTAVRPSFGYARHLD